jgi:hypothetical protein
VITPVCAVVAVMTLVVMVASAVAWNAGETGAAVALVVAVVALGLGCAALAAHVIRLRARVNRRMVLLLEPR